MSQISDDAILGMPFLEEHRCRVYFEKVTLHLAAQDLVCNDRYGRLLRSHIQVVNQQHINPCSAMLLADKIPTQNQKSLELAERRNFLVFIAFCVSIPDKCEQTTGHCVNSTNQALQIRAGPVVGPYTTIDETDIQERREQGKRKRQDGEQQELSTNYATIAKPLYQLTKKNARWKWSEVAQSSFKELKVGWPCLRCGNTPKRPIHWAMMPVSSEWELPCPPKKVLENGWCSTAVSH